MSRGPSEAYGTTDARAFAYFVAGLFAERTGSPDAADLYGMAMRLDPQYHKALNNRGRLMLAEGSEAYVAGTDDAKTERLFNDATGLFARAKVIQPDIAEYHYNLATTLSYLGRLQARLGNLALAVDRQRESIAAYDEALSRLAQEAAEEGTRSWNGVRRLWRPPHDDATAMRGAERQALKASVHLQMAISWAILRQLEGKKTPAPEEDAAIAGAIEICGARPNTPAHPRLEYNLACYYAVTGNLEDAIPLFLTLRAIHPRTVDDVLRDPDLADCPKILALFSPSPAPPPSPPRSPGRGPATKPVDDPERDEPT